jgi:hypothetical protein
MSPIDPKPVTPAEALLPCPRRMVLGSLHSVREFDIRHGVSHG